MALRTSAAAAPLSDVLPARATGPVAATTAPEGGAKPIDLQKKVTALIDGLASLGMVFEPWQVAAYVTAVRTKPFVVLAGVSGTGKSKLPRLAAELTGSAFRLVPVKPDWTDSAQTIGFENLAGQFVPGEFLLEAEEATANEARQHFILLDEMNLARIEYYLAEVLSLLEERRRQADGSIVSPPLAPNAPPDAAGRVWSGVAIPGNLAVIGSLNMDETTHSFSRKVLDRAFVLEFADIDLTSLPASPKPVEQVEWSMDDWAPPILSVRELPVTHETTFKIVGEELGKVNDLLVPLQVQVGYRVRDELVIFMANAAACIDSFTTRAGAKVDPLDLGMSMKVLPRVQGGGPSIKRALDGLRAWATGEGSIPRYPLTLARLEAMTRRFDDEGFTSFWL
jgi:GTPase subunit of restriction endonuclease